MANSMRCVGLDVHARETQAAVLDLDTGELGYRRIRGRPHEVVPYLERLERPLRAVYEAGPTGYGLARRARERGLDVQVCAPGHILRRRQDRIKTDKRDAARLARLLLAGELRLVHVPEPWQEELRDVVRCREDLRVDLMRTRHRISKLLLRRERYYPGPGRAWTHRHRAWLSALRFDDRASQVVLSDYLHAHDVLLARREQLEAELFELALASPFASTVRNLRCLRGSTPSRRSGSAAKCSTSIASAPSNSRASSAWCPRRTRPARSSAGAPSPRPAQSTPAGSWSRRPGTTATSPTSPTNCAAAKRAATRARSTSLGERSAACIAAGSGSPPSAASSRPRWRSRWRASSAASVGRSPRFADDPDNGNTAAGAARSGDGNGAT